MYHIQVGGWEGARARCALLSCGGSARTRTPSAARPRSAAAFVGVGPSSAERGEVFWGNPFPVPQGQGPVGHEAVVRQELGNGGDSSAQSLVLPVEIQSKLWIR